MVHVINLNYDTSETKLIIEQIFMCLVIEGQIEIEDKNEDFSKQPFNELTDFRANLSFVMQL